MAQAARRVHERDTTLASITAAILSPLRESVNLPGPACGTRFTNPGQSAGRDHEDSPAHLS
jgi:hypothetical protein